MPVMSVLGLILSAVLSGIAAAVTVYRVMRTVMAMGGGPVAVFDPQETATLVGVLVCLGVGVLGFSIVTALRSGDPGSDG